MNEYQRYLIEEFADEYHERRMSRRDLVRRAVLIMGGVPAGMAALAAVGCGDDENEFPEGVGTPERTPVPATPAADATISPAASPSPVSGDIRTSDVRFAGPGSDLLGHLARPAGEAIELYLNRRGYRKFHRQKINDFYVRTDDIGNDLTLDGFVVAAAISD